MPSVRSSSNLQLEYFITYSRNGVPKVHKECIDYEITWCGDGIVDTNIDTDLTTPGVQGEQCDPNDASHAGW